MVSNSDVPPIVPFDFGLAFKWSLHVPLGEAEKSEHYKLAADAYEVVPHDEGNTKWFVPVTPEGEIAYFLTRVSYVDSAGKAYTTSDCWQMNDKGVYVRCDHENSHQMT